MYTHVVLFRLHEPERAEEAADMLRSLQGQIPTLRTLEVGVDDLAQDRSSQLCLITRFDDRDGYLAYHNHPIHQDLLKRFGPWVQEARKTDWG